MFENNLKALFLVSPQLASKLFAMTKTERFEVFISDKDNANINLYDKELDKPLYTHIPLEENISLYNSFKEKYYRYPFLFLYGLGNGVFAKMLVSNTALKTLFIFEPNIEILYIVFHLIDFSEEIKSQKIRFSLVSDISHNDILFMLQNPDVKAFLKTFTLHNESDYYIQNYSDSIIELNRIIAQQIENVILFEGNDAKDSIIGLDHHLQHISAIVESYPYKQIMDNKPSKHAVIVSTGPSLHKQLPLLKKYKDKLTILCIDASLPILQKEQIAPDFVFSLERVEATAKFFKDLDKELLKDTMFIVTSITHPRTLSYLRGMKISMTMRPFSYTKMFKLSNWAYIGLGMSAANMAFEFAYVARFDTITFIGQDLSFGKDGTTHSKGALYGENETQYKHNDTIKGWYGDEVRTSRVWKMFLRFFKRDIPDVVAQGIDVYNCTEGGAYIDGAEHIPFAEFLDKVSDNPDKKILSDLEYMSESKKQHLMKRSKKYICLLSTHLKKVKEEVEGAFLQIMETIDYLETINKENRLTELEMEPLLKSVDKIDAIKDIYEQDKYINKMRNITSPFIVNAELELAKIVVMKSDTDIEKQVKVIEWIYAHKSWLFFLAGTLDNIIFIMDKNYKAVYDLY
jgi:hypothetical protein